jgi:hypothetical protein
MGTFDCIVEMVSVLRTDPQYLLKRLLPWTVQLDEEPTLRKKIFLELTEEDFCRRMCVGCIL